MENFRKLSNLKEIAALLEQLSRPGVAELRYDLLADAGYSTDELPPQERRKPRRAFQTFRFVLRYRTTLIVGQPDDRLREFWDCGKSLFPDWIGFSSDRCSQDEDLVATYQQFVRETDADFTNQ